VYVGSENTRVRSSSKLSLARDYSDAFTLRGRRLEPNIFPKDFSPAIISYTCRLIASHRMHILDRRWDAGGNRALMMRKRAISWLVVARNKRQWRRNRAVSFSVHFAHIVCTRVIRTFFSFFFSFRELAHYREIKQISNANEW